MLNKNWLKISLFYFLSIALIGTLLRFGFFSGNLVHNYKNLLHTHSHIAFLGWVYPVLFYIITKNYLTEIQFNKGLYKLQFYLTQIVIFCMFFSFLMQGYGLFSIIASSIFQFLTYWFVIRFFIDTKSLKNFSIKFIKLALFCLVLSSFGTWGLAILKAKHINSTEIYNMAIYFYLHFQYNGWFTYSILGLFLYIIEKNRVKFNYSYLKKSYFFLLISVFSTYFLSLLGFEINSYLYITSIISAIIQIMGILCLLIAFSKTYQNIYSLFSENIRFLFIISFLSLLIKITLQLLSTFSIFNSLAFNNRYIVIYYIHLVLIGFISFFLFTYLLKENILQSNNLSKKGIVMIIAGFCITEPLLLIQGLGIYFQYNFFIIFLFSFLMFFGLFLLLLSQIKIIYTLKNNFEKLFSINKKRLPLNDSL